jgi:hypothetical protein
MPGGVNTASGAAALYSDNNRNHNTASGYEVLRYNSTGVPNTATGVGALNCNSTGSANTASRWSALSSNTGGTDNTASGAAALQRNTTGKYNIGLGSNAGIKIITGSNNIDIGGAGSGDESNIIRIGTRGTQKKTYIAGIYRTTAAGGFAVEVTNSGQLVYVPSSVRYKRDIRNIGTASAGLMRLWPVSFRYKNDPSGSLQYGLVA